MAAHSIPAIVAALRSLPAHGGAAVLASVVSESGDPQMLGQRLLVLPDGGRVGALDEVACQAHVMARAAGFAASIAPSVLHYEIERARTGASDSPAARWIELLVEPIPPGTVPEWLRFLAEHLARRSLTSVMTVIATSGCARLRIGNRLLLADDGQMAGDLAIHQLTGAFVEEARRVLRELRPEVLAFGIPAGSAMVLLEVIAPAEEPTTARRRRW